MYITWPHLIEGWRDSWIFLIEYLIFLVYIEMSLICWEHFWSWTGIALICISSAILFNPDVLVSGSWELVKHEINTVLFVDFIYLMYTSIIILPMAAFYKWRKDKSNMEGPYLWIWPISWTGDELAELYYTGKLRSGDKGFAIIGDGEVLSHLSAHFGDEITPDSLANVNGIEKDSVNPGQNITVFSVTSNSINSTPTVSNFNSSALSPAAEFEQRWQDNFQIMLGPDNPLFVDAEQGIPNKYGVLIEVDDFGDPTYEGLFKTIEQEELINRVTETTVGEYQQIAWNEYLQGEEVGS